MESGQQSTPDTRRKPNQIEVESESTQLIESSSTSAGAAARPSLKLPGSIKFIIGNEFCERFSFYGMRTILALYFVDHLRMTEASATEAVHLFIVACYFTPLLGAFLSDSYLGKYKTILYLSLVYCLGNWAMAFSAMPGPGGSSGHAFWGAAVGLGLIALGTGGIKPCVAAFGGDQIKDSYANTPARDALLRSFFSAFYFSINAGSTISTVLTPVVRSNASYAAAFSLPAWLMMLALLLFLAGSSMYKHQPPGGNMLAEVLGVIWTALFDRSTQHKRYQAITADEEQPAIHRPPRSPQPGGKGLNPGQNKEEKVAAKSHWLDAAKAKHGSRAVEDVKALFRVLLLFAPAPVFWSLFDQQASRWVFQARKMDGRLFSGLVIQPDQMQVLNSLLILLMIPLFDNIIYPFFERRQASLRPIGRMVTGMGLSALAFIISGGLEFVVDGQTLPAPAGTNATVTSGGLLYLPANQLSSLLPYTGNATLAAVPGAAARVTAATFLGGSHLGGGEKFGCEGVQVDSLGRCVSMLWQTPQYVVMTAGEILFSITGLELAYSQAPASMRAAVQSFWLLTVAGGNLFTVLIVGTVGEYMSQTNEFFFFAGGCFLAMLAMMWAGRGFVYMSSQEGGTESGGRTPKTPAGGGAEPSRARTPRTPHTPSPIPTPTGPERGGHWEENVGSRLVPPASLRDGRVWMRHYENDPQDST